MKLRIFRIFCYAALIILFVGLAGFIYNERARESTPEELAWKRVGDISSHMPQLFRNFERVIWIADLEYPGQRITWTHEPALANICAEMVLEIHRAPGRSANHIAVIYSNTDNEIRLAMVNIDNRQIKGVTREITLFSPATFNEEIQSIWKPQPIEHLLPQQ
jgi:hypothetical protein